MQIENIILCLSLSALVVFCWHKYKNRKKYDVYVDIRDDGEVKTLKFTFDKEDDAINFLREMEKMYQIEVQYEDEN